MDPAGGLKRQRSISDEANAQSPGPAAYNPNDTFSVPRWVPLLQGPYLS